MEFSISVADSEKTAFGRCLGVVFNPQLMKITL